VTAAAPLPVVVFALGAARCALRQAEVRELLPLPRLWRPPGAPRCVEGLMNLGGEAIAVVPLAPLLLPGAEEAEEGPEAQLYHHLILLRGGPVALRVPRVLEAALVAPERLRPVARRETLNGCVEAEIEEEGGGLTHLLDAGRILLLREREALADLARAAAARLREWEPGAA
jgi:purine-binding chemotaxis protein CheW